MDRDSLRDLLDQHTLPPNHALPSLPPLPQTPHHSRRAYTGYDSDEPEAKYEPRSQRRRGPEREYPMSAIKGRQADARSTDVNSATIRRLPRSATLPSLTKEASMTRGRPQFETSYPTLSTRQSSLNTARNVSPSKLDFASPAVQTSALLHPSSAAKSTADSPFKLRRDVSASFVLPQGADVSMLQDVTFGELGRLSLGNDTLDMGFSDSAKNDADEVAIKKEPHGGGGRYGEIGSGGAGGPPTVAMSKGSGYDQPTVLPCTPCKELLDSTNLIAQEEPPLDSSNSLATAIPSRSPRPATNTTSRRNGSIQKPRLPASTCFSNFLAPPTFDHAGDMSTLLPVSPLKTRHPMADEYLLTQTKMEDESMMSLSMPLVSPVKRASQILAPLCLGKTSPAKTPRNVKNQMEPDAADLTMDIQQMMARVRPKGILGAEETVMDLYRADLDDDDGNTSLLGGNFLPPDLRPGLVRSKSLSRLELERQSANTTAPTSSICPTRTLPRTRPSNYTPTTAAAHSSPTRARPAPFSAITSSRPSLSVGAVPLPSSASLRKLDLPTRRLASPIRPTLAPIASSSRIATVPARTTTSTVTRPTAKSSMPPPSTASSRMPQPAKSRVASTTGAASTNRASILPRATSVRSLSKPAPSETSNMGARSSRPTSRPTALPQPAAGPSARSAAPRSFGGDAAGISNRLPRPVPAVPSARSTKGSMGPPSVPPARQIAVPTSVRSRHLSTPATTLSGPPSNRPSATSARAPTSRASTLPASRSAVSSDSTKAHTASESRFVQTRLAPAPASAARQTGTVSKPSSKSTAAADLADIRARLDRLQARHQTTRPAR